MNDSRLSLHTSPRSDPGFPEAATARKCHQNYDAHLMVQNLTIFFPYLVTRCNLVTSVELKSYANCLIPDGDTIQLFNTSQITIIKDSAD